jgi:hypothetical protein
MGVTVKVSMHGNEHSCTTKPTAVEEVIHQQFAKVDNLPKEVSNLDAEFYLWPVGVSFSSCNCGFS